MPGSVFTSIQQESTWIQAQFLQTPTQYQLPGYRIVSTPPQFTPCLHLASLPKDTASVDQVTTISTLLTTFLHIRPLHCLIKLSCISITAWSMYGMVNCSQRTGVSPLVLWTQFNIVRERFIIAKK